MKRALPAILLVALAGCGAQAQTSSVDRFQGEQRAVAQKVEDLQSAGKRGKAEDICSDILATSLVDRLDSAGTDCATEIKKAIDDTSDFGLDVRSVTITGSDATAEVQQGEDGPKDTIELTREKGGWRVTSLGAR